jgi:AraC-like DNA-binding protein
VQAIARRWGFEDVAHFTRIFKASFGEPPGQYRRGELVGRHQPEP